MNRMRYRTLLLSVLLAALCFGVFYYYWLGTREEKVMDGTLVQHVSEEEKSA